MQDEQLHERIERYFAEAMPPDERARFENEMRADAEFFEEVEIHRLAIKGLQRPAVDRLRKKFAEWEAELEEQNTPTPLTARSPEKYIPWLWVAWVVLFLMALAVLLWTFRVLRTVQPGGHKEEVLIVQHDSTVTVLKDEILQKQKELSALSEESHARADSLQLEIKKLKDELIRLEKARQRIIDSPETEHFRFALSLAPEYDLALRGDPGDDNRLHPLIRSAYRAIRERKFTQAADLLKQVDPNDDNGQRVVLYELPYALFYAGKFGEALPAFNELQKTDKAEVGKIEWYIVLCYIGEGRDAHTRKALAAILQNPRHAFYDEAVALREKLENKSKLPDEK